MDAEPSEEINAKDKMVNQRKEAIEDMEKTQKNKKEKNVKSRALVAVTRAAITAPGFEEQKHLYKLQLSVQASNS